MTTTAFITGLNGFVASHLAEYLLANTDWSIVGTLRSHSSTDNLLNLASWLNQNHRIRAVEADLTDARSLDRAVLDAEPSYVFHLAAQSFPGTSIAAPSATIEANILGTLNVLEAVRQHAPRAWVHVCSSAEVYGRTPGVLTEATPYHMASPYSLSKIGTDLLGRYYAEAHSLNTVTTRMFTHTGPRRGDTLAESSFAKQIAMVEAGRLKPPLRVGNLNSTRTIADVRDTVRAYHMALTVAPQRGAVYNIGGSTTRTMRELLAMLFEAAGQTYPVQVDEGRLRPVDADCQIPDCSAFMQHTGWRPEIPLEQTLRDLLEYWRGRVRSGAVVLQR